MIEMNKHLPIKEDYGIGIIPNSMIMKVVIGYLYFHINPNYRVFLCKYQDKISKNNHTYRNRSNGMKNCHRYFILQLNR